MYNGLIDCRVSLILLYYGYINIGIYKFKEDILSLYDIYKLEL